MRWNGQQLDSDRARTTLARAATGALAVIGDQTVAGITPGTAAAEAKPAEVKPAETKPAAAKQAG